MEEVEVQESIKTISSQALSLLQQGFYLCVPLYKKESSLNDDLQFITAQLFTSTQMTSESTLLLVNECRLWDSEVLLRSVAEGTLRYLYLFSSNEDSNLKNAEEFWNTLPEIKMLTNHYKITNLLSFVDKDNEEWKPFVDMLIPDSELKELKSKFPKKIRKAIEQRWSFTEVLQSLSNEESELDFLSGLLYNYSLASSLIHQDSYSLKLIHDRSFRQDSRRNSLELAHACRLISDILTYAILRIRTYFKNYKLDSNHLNVYLITLSSFLDDLKVYYKTWFDIEYNSKSDK